MRVFSKTNMQKNILLVLGANLKQIRTKAGLSIKELSDRSRVSKDTISSVEAGRTNPLFSTIYKVASALKSTPSSLCKGF